MKGDMNKSKKMKGDMNRSKEIRTIRRRTPKIEGDLRKGDWRNQRRSKEMVHMHETSQVS